jgi:UDP-N-acetyl-2-amino-2-deoxyglucuronate dehydrogenase
LRKTGVAIIGLGMAVGPHARSLADLSDRVVVRHAFSPTAERRAAFAKAHGVPAAGDLDAVLADPGVDAVLILTPPNTHLDLVRRAAAAGKHILLEKPLEVSIERSEALVDAADAAGVTLGVVLQRRFSPGALALSERIAAGVLGEIVGASVRLGNWRPQSYYDEPGRGTRSRDGGGVLLTQGIHMLDLYVALAGLPAEVAAYAATSSVHRMETEDIVAAAARFENGAIGAISATTAAYPGFPDAIELIGTLGTAHLVGESLRIWMKDGEAVEVGSTTGSGGSGADPMAFSHHQHRALITDFLDALEDGRPPAVTGRGTLAVHDLIGALLTSAGTGRPSAVRRR